MNKLIILLLSLLFFNNSYSQNGKLLSKKLIDLSKTPYWYQFSFEDSLKPEYKHLNNLNFYAITYESDSLIINGITVEPKKKGNYPVVIFNRGGNRNFASLDVSTLIYFTSKLASKGYVIIGSNYRDKDEFGGADINDVLYLTETIKEIEKADTNRIGMFGWSRGGMMTYLALKKSDKIKTAIIGNGSFNLLKIAEKKPHFDTNVIAQCVPNYWENREAELKKRSVVYWVDDLNKNSSILILCGTKDRRVDYRQTDEIASRLTEIQYDFVLKKYETNHGFTDKRKELNEEVINWFDKKLKN